MNLCPVCKSAALVIQNNNYYCPICKIFIGKANSQATATVNNPVQPSINPSAPQQIIQDKPIKDNLGLFTGLIKKGTIFIIFILIIYSLLQNFFYIDLQNKCFIRISPSWLELSNASIKEALNILRITSPTKYQNVCQRVNLINPNLSCGGFGGGCFSEQKSKTIDISTFHGEVVFATVAIIHETCHVQQRDESRPYDEKECYTVGYQVLKDVISY